MEMSEMIAAMQEKPDAGYRSKPTGNMTGVI